MARLKKNGNLSGAVGNIVFVNDGDRVYVRSKPGNVKQTKNTKNASNTFGWVSKQEKQFRLLLQSKIGLIPGQYFAARHMARLGKTIIRDKSSSGHVIAEFQDPIALIGFEFNPKLDWERCTNFFPVFEIDNNQFFTVSIPALSWSKEIKPPLSADQAIINFHAIHTDLNQNTIALDVYSSLSVSIKEKEIIPSQEWTLNIPKKTKWLLVIAIINFDSAKKQLEKIQKTAGTYLFAKSITY